MEAITAILTDVFLIFFAAKFMASVFDRLGQPPVIGELLAGILIGPFAFGLIGQPSPALVETFHGDPEAAGEALTMVYEVLSELGVIVLLFFVGLETRLEDILKVGPRAAGVGTAGVVVPFALGTAYMVMRGEDFGTAIFLGTAMVATSVGITARVLRDMHRTRSQEAQIILGAAVIDDILAMLLLAVVAGLAGGGGFSPLSITILGIEAIAFTIFTVLIGTRLVRRYSIHWERIPVENSPFVVAIVLMLGLAAVSGRTGMAAIIGAFLAGMVVAEASDHYQLERWVTPVYEFLTPFFFVFIGSQVDWRLFLDGSLLGVAAVVTLLAIVGKLAGSAMGTVGMRVRSIAIIGVGMVPRGEVGLIVAGLGRSLGAIPAELFSVVVIMSIVTTLVAPPLLKVLFARPEAELREEAEIAET